jgi:excinuclease ABC subunit B
MASASSFSSSQGKLLEAQRIEQRTRYDIEMLARSACARASKLFADTLGPRARQRAVHAPGLLPDDFLLFVDESHVTLPQVRGMYAGTTRARRTLSITASACPRPTTTAR